MSLTNSMQFESLSLVYIDDMEDFERDSLPLLILMLSYLTNRHYHLLTKELPEEMRNDQPKVVYLPAHNSEKVTYPTHKRGPSKLKVKRSRQLLETSHSIGDWYYSFDKVAQPVFHQTTSQSNFTARSMCVSNAGS